MNEPVYVDQLTRCIKTRRWHHDASCHLFVFPGNEEALHALASAIGLKREWFQSGSTMPHYDLTENKRRAALDAGAVEAQRLTVVEAIRSWRSCATKVATPKVQMDLFAVRLDVCATTGCRATVETMVRT